MPARLPQPCPLHHKPAPARADGSDLASAYPRPPPPTSLLRPILPEPGDWTARPSSRAAHPTPDLPTCQTRPAPANPPRQPPSVHHKPGPAGPGRAAPTPQPPLSPGRSQPSRRPTPHQPYPPQDDVPRHAEATPVQADLSCPVRSGLYVPPRPAPTSRPSAGPPSPAPSRTDCPRRSCPAPHPAVPSPAAPTTLAAPRADLISPGHADLTPLPTTLRTARADVPCPAVPRRASSHRARPTQPCPARLVKHPRAAPLQARPTCLPTPHPRSPTRHFEPGLRVPSRPRPCHPEPTTPHRPAHPRCAPAHPRPTRHRGPTHAAPAAPDPPVLCTPDQPGPTCQASPSHDSPTRASRTRPGPHGDSRGGPVGRVRR